ncbi:MAG TPA: acyl-CoA dehydrogenase [Patescibacteria group bacterium]|nr:acyl-CoA dehydrogenase [Patescibacteria group bacterium]
MSQYRPPIDDMIFALTRIAGLDGLPQAEDLGADDIRMVLESAGQLAAEVLSPLNAIGDKNPSRLENGRVITPPGFKEAYKQYCDGGWNGVPFSPEHGGQGLPLPIAFAVQEMWQSANMAFGLCPMLNQAAVDAIELHGAPAQKKTYLEKLVSGEWTGTMNLTEPQAGTDLGAIRASAEKQSDGTYLLRGQKIFITYGEHDFTPNIIHTVLARVPGAPEGTKGISMFIVPKVLADGKRNDVKCVSLEHKMGIHASPTCVMQYGEERGAVAYLIGRENEGLKYMFTMMNNARLNVGLQGVAIAERAYQHAVAYAKDRVQGNRLNDKSGGRVPIIDHPDVRRMLLSMRAQIEAARGLAYEAAKAMELGRRGDTAAQARVDLLTPVVKAWCTDMAQEVASTALQVHGGMGFIEETGAAQFYRDARIAPIYEGTNGIQSMDLALRKVAMDGGKAMKAWLDEADKEAKKFSAAGDDADWHEELTLGLAGLRGATEAVLNLARGNDLENIASVAAPYLQAFGLIAGAAVMAKSVIAANDSKADFKSAKIVTARLYGTHILPRSRGAVQTVLSGARAVSGCGSEFF